MERIFKVWYNYEPLFKKSKLYQRFITNLYPCLYEIHDGIVKENKHLRTYDSDTDDRIFIKQLLNLKNNFTDAEVLQEITTFVIAVSN
jgi:hypothetical protein